MQEQGKEANLKRINRLILTIGIHQSLLKIYKRFRKPKASKFLRSELKYLKKELKIRKKL